MEETLYVFRESSLRSFLSSEPLVLRVTNHTCSYSGESKP